MARRTATASPGGSGWRIGGIPVMEAMQIIGAGITVAGAAWELGKRIWDDVGERMGENRQEGNPDTDSA